MVRFKGLKGIFSPTIYFSFTFFILLTQQGFADSNVRISGEVQSYEEGVYKIQTDQAVVNIQNSKLTTSLRQELNSNIGHRVQIDIPSTAITSHQQPNRVPASISVPDGTNGRVGGGHH